MTVLVNQPQGPIYEVALATPQVMSNAASPDKTKMATRPPVPPVASISEMFMGYILSLKVLTHRFPNFTQHACNYKGDFQSLTRRFVKGCTSSPFVSAHDARDLSDPFIMDLTGAGMRDSPII
jgi:hypothetical protein